MVSQLPSHARVWVYAADRVLSPEEATQVARTTKDFLKTWAAHGTQLVTDGRLLFDRFLVLMVDEQRAGASGCSIDASVHFVRALGAQLNVDFFNRMIFHYRDAQGNVQSLSRNEFKAAYSKGILNGATSVFDPLVKTVEELTSSFEKPLEASWHARMV
jgi:hypothetical protein